MGNAAKRRQIGKLLKEHKFGPLYKGNKKVAWTSLRGSILNSLLHKLKFKPGDIVNDCDVFNHKIIKWLPEKFKFGRWSKGDRLITGWIFNVDQFEKENGTWSCGCPYSPDPPQTREQIEKYMLAWRSDEKSDWNKDEWHLKIYAALKNNQYICDENGILLPEFKRF